MQQFRRGIRVIYRKRFWKGDIALTETQLRNAMTTYGDTVYRLALCRMQSAPDAEDVYQDVFLRLFSQNTADWTGDHIKAWLIRTTVNRCNDLYRFRLRKPVCLLNEVQAIVGPVADDYRELWEAIALLPDNQRTAIHLHYAEGYSCEEIAAALHLPAATVRSRLSRGRKRLRTRLGGSDDE